MCRLFGLIANKPVDAKFSILSGPTPFRQLGAKNPDGWGVGWYLGGVARVEKKPERAEKSSSLARVARGVESYVFIAHVRYSTCGATREENCHPFRFREWLFAHNGTVDRESLWRRLDAHHKRAISGDTDSEVYFHWIVQNIEDKRDPVAGIEAALKEVESKSALNFLLSDGVSLWAYRKAVKNEEYYSLFYLERPAKRQGPQTLHSKQVGMLIESKRLRGEEAVLVCSEKLTDDEDWREIPLGKLLGISRDMSIQLLDL